MTTWTHKGVEISFNEGAGDFVATLEGKKVRAASLQAMKDKINKRVAVESFEFLDDRRSEIKIGRIVGFKRGQFVDEDGRSHYSVIRNTPENKQALDELVALRKKNNAEIERLKLEIGEAADKITRERAS